jgi:surface protein
MTVITNRNIRKLIRLAMNDKPGFPADLEEVEIGDWDVSRVTNMDNLFHDLEYFNDPIGQWDVSNVTSMKGMFSGADLFNQPIGDWDVSKVTDMNEMFYQAVSFNQPIGDWDVSRVTDMGYMFYQAESFNQPIGYWDVSSVTYMAGMFREAESFNQPIGNWNVYNVQNMAYMFDGASRFNQPIENWQVGDVTNMTNMFHDAVSFSKPLPHLYLSRATMVRMFSNEANLINYLERVRLSEQQSTNVRVAQTIQEYMSMCKTADQTDDDCMNNDCPVCIQKFIIKSNLVRPVMFHKAVNSRGEEIWSCPVHAEEQLKHSATNCIGCRARLSIPDSYIDEISISMNPDMFEAKARAIQLQSVIRGHRTRKSSTGRTVANKVKRQQTIKQNRSAFNAAFPPSISRSLSKSRARSNSMTRSKSNSMTRSNRRSADF